MKYVSKFIYRRTIHNVKLFIDLVVGRCTGVPPSYSYFCIWPMCRYNWVRLNFCACKLTDFRQGYYVCCRAEDLLVGSIGFCTEGISSYHLFMWCSRTLLFLLFTATFLFLFDIIGTIRNSENYTNWMNNISLIIFFIVCEHQNMKRWFVEINRLIHNAVVRMKKLSSVPFECYNNSRQYLPYLWL